MSFSVGIGALDWERAQGADLPKVGSACTMVVCRHAEVRSLESDVPPDPCRGCGLLWSL